MNDIKYPVICPLLNNSRITKDICFDIHMVVCGEAPLSTAPKEIFALKDYVNVCKNCEFHRND